MRSPLVRLDKACETRVGSVGSETGPSTLTSWRSGRMGRSGFWAGIAVPSRRVPKTERAERAWAGRSLSGGRLGRGRFGLAHSKASQL